MHLPKETQFAEVTALDNVLNELSNRITIIKVDISERETRQNDANIIMARDNAYQYQSVTDEARRIYHAEGAAIGQLRRELQPLEQRCDVLYKQRGTLQRQLSESEAQRQYEGETVKGNLAKIVKLSKAIIEQDAKLDKLNIELTALDKIANDQSECEAGHDRYKAEYQALTQELDQAEAAYTLDASMPNPIGLRRRVAEAKKKYDYTVKHLPTQVLLDSIAEKRESLQAEISSIESDKKELDAEWWAKQSLIAEIQYREKVPKILALVRSMIACDSMSNGKSNVGMNLLERLKSKGLSTPRIFTDRPAIFDGLLDNLDEEKSRIQAEFDDNLKDLTL
jgi:cytochrome c556